MNRNPSPKDRIKKGEVRNPLGQKAHDQEKKALKRFTKETYRTLIESAFQRSMGEIRALMSDKDARDKLSPMEFTVLSSLMKGASKGDPHNAELFATRIIGKIPDMIKVDATNLSANASVEEVKAILAKIEEEI